MPISRNRRRSKPIRSSAAQSAENTKNVNSNIKERNTAEPHRRSWMRSVWRTFWEIVGPILALVQFYFFLSPDVKIAMGTSLDPQQILSTPFIVTNTGHVPIYSLEFSCDLMPMRGDSLGSGGGFGEMRAGFLGPVDRLLPGDSVARRCTSTSHGMIGTHIKMIVKFKWPIIGKNDEISKMFRVEKDDVGLFLLPDVIPPGEPMKGFFTIKPPPH